MERDYNEYLAVHVLNEHRPISYRTLSRALKIHNNLAKQMLFEFHRKQNAKKPGSVYATYVIFGTKLATLQTHALRNKTKQQPTADPDGDDDMRSSPPLPGSSMPRAEDEVDSKEEERPSPVKTLMLARETNMDRATAQFETISSIHIYSLTANGLGNMQELIECNRSIATTYVTEDPLKDWRQYGTIQNPNARRRTTRLAPPPASTSSPKTEFQESNTTEAKKEAVRAHEEAVKPATASKPPSLQKQSSSIFKAFGKAKGKPTHEKKTASAEATPNPEREDEPMGGLSEEDASENDDQTEEKEAETLEGKSKKERQKELEAMMAKEDEEMDEPIEDVEAAADSQSEKADNQSQMDEEPKEHVEISNGRRRGRRRVMKKKTVKDEEGFIVTTEEPAWESFSEDEPVAKKAKTSAVPSTGAMSRTGSKKGAKPGQGNIMSFFGRK